MTYSLNALNASTSAKGKSKSAARPGMVARFGHEMLLLAGLLALVFWLASMFSYSPQDPAWSTSGAGHARLVANWIDGDFSVAPGEVVLLENCRLNVGEKKNKPELAAKLGKLCDIFVHDAFGTAHRAEGTTYGIAETAPIACAGPLLAAEMDAIGKALANPKRPLIAIVAGSKVSTKLTILQALAKNVDGLIVGGGIANTFMLAAGLKIGKSLAEPDLLDLVKALNGSRWQLFRYIQLPGSLPYLFSGMKVATVLAVAGAVVGEFIASDKGLGYLMIQVQASLDTPAVFMAVLLITALGVLLYGLVLLLERLFITQDARLQ